MALRGTLPGAGRLRRRLRQFPAPAGIVWVVGCCGAGRIVSPMSVLHPESALSNRPWKSNEVNLRDAVPGSRPRRSGPTGAESRVRNVRALTVIEVLVAVLLLSVGMLGLLSAATVIAQTLVYSHSYTEASAIASQFLETLRTEGCATAGDGSWSDGAQTVSWQSREISPDVRRATVVVVTPALRRSRADTFSVTVPC